MAKRNRKPPPAPPAELDNAISLAVLDPKKVTQVFMWIVQGQTEGHIREAIEQLWPADDPRPLIIAAIHQLTESAKFNADIVRGWCFEAYRELYRQMVAMGDFPGALRAVSKLETMARQAGPPG